MAVFPGDVGKGGGDIILALDNRPFEFGGRDRNAFPIYIGGKKHVIETGGKGWGSGRALIGEPLHQDGVIGAVLHQAVRSGFQDKGFGFRSDRKGCSGDDG